VKLISKLEASTFSKFSLPIENTTKKLNAGHANLQFYLFTNKVNNYQICDN